MRVLALTVGLPAVGKTTFVRTWPAFRGFVHVEADQFARDYREFWVAVEREGRDLHQSLVLDGSFHLRRARSRAMSLVPRARVVAYVFPLDLDLSLSRNEARGPKCPREIIFRNLWAWEQPSLDEGIHEIVPVAPEMVR